MHCDTLAQSFCLCPIDLGFGCLELVALVAHRTRFKVRTCCWNDFRADGRHHLFWQHALLGAALLAAPLLLEAR